MMSRVTLLILANLVLYLSLFFLAVDITVRCQQLKVFIKGWLIHLKKKIVYLKLQIFIVPNTQKFLSL